MKLTVSILAAFFLGMTCGGYFGFQSSEQHEKQVTLLQLHREKLSELQELQIERQQEVWKLEQKVALAREALLKSKNESPTIPEHVVEQALRQRDPEYVSIREQWLSLTNILRNETQETGSNPNRRLTDDLRELEEEIELRRENARRDLAETYKNESVLEHQEQYEHTQAQLGIETAGLKQITDELASLKSSSAT